MAPSFLFIVNELHTDDDPETGSVFPKQVNQRWRPPVVARGFYPQVPGYVYRWDNGIVSYAQDSVWDDTHGAIYAPDHNGDIVWPDLYRSATVFYCNRFDKFYTAQGDVTSRDIKDCGPEDDWHPLTFNHHRGNAYADHAGDQEYVTAKKATWIGQVLPKEYRSERESTGTNRGGLSGLLPIIISLIAFSAGPDYLYDILVHQQAWRNRRWKKHSQEHGSK